MPHPRAFSHIGLFVDDLDRAVDFYRDVLGCYVVMEPSTVPNDDSPIGIMCQDVFGTDWDTFRIAHLSTADGIGIELFEFPETAPHDDHLNPSRNGIFHFCIQDPDIESLVETIKAHGGKQRMPIRAYYPDEKPYKMVYCEDPFGNLLEIYTHSYELTYSKGAYE